MTELLPPSDLPAFEVLFDHSELNPALPAGLLRFVGNLGFPEQSAGEPGRPWVYANFVQSLDGLVSFGGRRHSGGWIAQNRHDRWMMDFLRAHADAVLCGARSLRLETLSGPIPRGPVYRIVHPEILRYRTECLGKKKLIIIVATASGDLLPQDYRLFESNEVEAWIATTPDGRERLGDAGKTRVLVSDASGAHNGLDLGELLRRLRNEEGIAHLLTEGGPTLYGHLARGGWVDEKFVTVAPQEIGADVPAAQERAEWEPQAATVARPTSFAGPGFTVETARWYRWISCRRAGDHELNRYRIAGQSNRAE
jgi:riboflavin biosynthesis pyrimidine reductase